MSERYTRLSSLPENLYAEGWPVIISAGNLLKDNQTGKIMAQLKIRNLSPTPLKALKLLIHTMDVAGDALDGDVEYEYLDLSAHQGEEFGQKAAIPLPNASTRSISVSIRRAAFADNNIWTGSEKGSEPLPAGESLPAHLGDAELLRQYELKFGGSCRYLPREHKDLWLCACGTWNREDTCFRCQKRREALLTADLAALNREKEARLAQEKAQREAREAAEKAAAAAKARKTKKALIIAIPSLLVCIALTLVYWKLILPSNRYKQAAAFFEQQQYEQAQAGFEQLGDYKDSAMRAAYAGAFSLMQEGKYPEAEQAFSALQDFEGSASMAAKASYAQAEALAQADHPEEALARFDALGDYEDSAERAAALRYELGSRALDAKDYDGALAYFEAIPTYRDSADILEKLKQDLYAKEELYQQAEALLKRGDTAHAAMLFYQVGDYRDGEALSYELWRKLLPAQTVSAQGGTMALLEDGTIIAAGNYDAYREALNHAIAKWDNVTDVSYGAYVAAVLKEDHTADCVDLIYDEMGVRVKQWRGIVKISADCSTVLGLRADGQVLRIGSDDYPNWVDEEWTDIVDIDAGVGVVVGLKADGTAVIAYSSEYNYNKAAISKWSDLVAVSAGMCVYGLKADGTVVAAAPDSEPFYSDLTSVSSWRDITAISAGWNMVIGLRADGGIVALGAWWTDVNSYSSRHSYEEYFQKNPPKNVVAISAGVSHVVLLTADGKLIAVGENEYDACDVGSWKNIRLP